MTAEITTVGGELPEGSYDAVEWSFSNSAVQLVDQSGNTATVKGASSGTATATAKLTVKNGDKKATISSSPFKITVTNDRIASIIDLTTIENGVTVPVDSPIELADMKEVREYNLSATVRDGKNEVIENPSLLWKSSNTKVAEIKGQGNEAILTVKTETGAAVISVTANKNGGYTKSFRVVVKDSTPRLHLWQQSTLYLPMGMKWQVKALQYFWQMAEVPVLRLRRHRVLLRNIRLEDRKTSGPENIKYLCR